MAVDFSQALAPLQGLSQGPSFWDRVNEGMEQAERRKLRALQQEQNQRALQNQSLDMALRFAQTGMMQPDQIGALIESTGGSLPQAALPLLKGVVQNAKKKQKLADQQGQAAFATGTESGFSDRAKGLGNELSGPNALSSTVQSLRDQEQLAGGPSNPLAQAALQALTARAAAEAGTIEGETRREVAKEGRGEAREIRKEERKRRVKMMDAALPDNPTFENVLSVRGEFRNLSGDFIQVRDAYRRIQESAEEPSAAGDMALIFNFMKMLDPGSTVREGEFANVQNTPGVSERVRAMYNRVLGGERLTETSRGDFLNRSQRLLRAQLKGQRDLEKDFRQFARRKGIDPNDVIIDFVGDLRGFKVGGGQSRERGTSGVGETIPIPGQQGVLRRVR